MSCGPGSAPARTRRLALLALLIAPGTGCARGAAKGAAPPALPVKIEVARSVAVDDTTEYVATLKSRGSAAIMPQVEGHITAIFVRSGARVAAGAPLMQIDPAEAAGRGEEPGGHARGQAGRAGVRPAAIRAGEGPAGRRASPASRTSTRPRPRSTPRRPSCNRVESQVREQQAQLRYYRVTAPDRRDRGRHPGARGRPRDGLHAAHHRGPARASWRPTSPSRSSAPRSCGTGLPVRILDGDRPGRGGEPRHASSRPQVDDQTQTVLVKAGIERPGRAAPGAVHPRPGRVGHARRARWCRCSPSRASAASTSPSWRRTEKGGPGGAPAAGAGGRDRGQRLRGAGGDQAGRPGDRLRHPVPARRRAGEPAGRRRPCSSTSSSGGPSSPPSARC